MSKRQPNHPSMTEQSALENVAYTHDNHTKASEQINPKELMSSKETAKKMKQYTK